MHAIAYDDIHDEIVVPIPFSQSILTFRGGANGEEPPIRVIQGPLTQLKNQTDQLAIDPVHNEIYVPQDDRVLVFPRGANGNVAPIRVLEGPDTLLGADFAAVDPVHNLLLVSGRPAEGGAESPRGGGAEWPRGGGGAVMIFNRTDQGNVKPRAMIRGPKTNLGGGNARIYAYPPRGEIIMAASEGGGGGGGFGSGQGGGGFGGGAEMATNRGFVGVWSIQDNGDVPPRWMIGGPRGVLLQIRGVALDPKNKSVIITDKRLNAILTYSFPEIF